jgi:hypothetical protein
MQENKKVMQGHLIVLYFGVPSISLMLQGAQRLAEIEKQHTEVFREPVVLERNDTAVRSHLESLFTRFNSDENPLSGGVNPEKQRWITEKQLHTSMSVGDAVRIEWADGSRDVWAVRGMGWEKITAE